MRRWSVRNARTLDRLYAWFERMLTAAHPAFQAIGYDRLERPVVVVERLVKGFLFDCQMCGQCALSRTGMSCPMNCPKSIRNGPCGGVRADGSCEVMPRMRCVWLDAYQGNRVIGDASRIAGINAAIDHRLRGTSSWLRVARGEASRVHA
jgi:hypothetical protein